MKKIVVVILIMMTLLVSGCDRQIDKKPEEKETSISKEEIKQEQLSEDTINISVITEEEIAQNNVIEESVALHNEQEVIDYFQAVEYEVDDLTKQAPSESVSIKLKNTFVTIVDFLFYDQPIGGMTFNMLTDSAKETVLNIVNKIDIKIDSAIPGYKDTIKTSTGRAYQSASVWIKNKMSELKEKVKNTLGEDTYQSLEEGKDNLVDSFKNAGQTIVEAGGKVKDKLKEWYENFRD